jgi:hypothetical protein
MWLESPELTTLTTYPDNHSRRVGEFSEQGLNVAITT